MKMVAVLALKNATKGFLKKAKNTGIRGGQDFEW
jgi:hypothetical protein